MILKQKTKNTVTTNFPSTSQNFLFDKRKSRRRINKNVEQYIEIRQQIGVQKYHQMIKASIVDYSLEGCGLIVTIKKPPKVGDVFLLNPAQLNPNLKPIKAQVRWCKLLKNDTFRIGVKYISLV